MNKIPSVDSFKKIKFEKEKAVRDQKRKDIRLYGEEQKFFNYVQNEILKMIQNGETSLSIEKQLEYNSSILWASYAYEHEQKYRKIVEYVLFDFKDAGYKIDISEYNLRYHAFSYSPPVAILKYTINE